MLKFKYVIAVRFIRNNQTSEEKDRLFKSLHISNNITDNTIIHFETQEITWE